MLTNKVYNLIILRMPVSGDNLYLTVNGTTVCFDDWGQGDMPIIFIHGFPFDKSCWQPQMSVLRAHYRVITYDIRGFGKSSISLEIPDMDTYADDLIQFMDHMGIQKAIVCGLSMGGYILLNAVHRFQERFQAIILCDTQCNSDTAEIKEKRNDAIAQVMGGRLNEFADQFMSKVFNADLVKEESILFARVKQIILGTSPETIIGALNALKNRKDMCGEMHIITVPALIICGEQDKLTPMIKSEALQKGIANAELYPISGSGHLSNMEQSEYFNQGIMAFIDKSSSAIVI